MRKIKGMDTGCPQGDGEWDMERWCRLGGDWGATGCYKGKQGIQEVKLGAAGNLNRT